MPHQNNKEGSVTRVNQQENFKHFIDIDSETNEKFFFSFNP